MSGRSGSSFSKLQKERARREKQMEKRARRQQRKLDKQVGATAQDGSEEHSANYSTDSGPPDSSQ